MNYVPDSSLKYLNCAGSIKANILYNKAYSPVELTDVAHYLQ